MGQHTIFTRPVSAARGPAPPFLPRSDGGLQALLILQPLLLSTLLQQGHGSLLLASCQALLRQALHGQSALVLAARRPPPPAWHLLMRPCHAVCGFRHDLCEHSVPAVYTMTDINSDAFIKMVRQYGRLRWTHRSAVVSRHACNCTAG